MNLRKIFGLGKKYKNELSSDVMAKELRFDENVLAIITEVANHDLHPLKISDLYDEDKETTVGIYFSALEEKAEEIVEQLQPQINQFGYLAFASERSFEEGSTCKIGIIKCNDQFEILKILQTNGENYDISNEDIISKLRQWHKRYPFIIIGADFDWIEAKYTVLPSTHEIKPFAREMYEFCPDIVEQGTGSIEALIEEIKETKKLFLWWD